MANRKRQLNGAQTARKGPQSRRSQPASQPAAAPAGKAAATEAAGSTSAAGTGTPAPARQAANGKAARGQAGGGRPGGKAAGPSGRASDGRASDGRASDGRAAGGRPATRTAAVQPAALNAWTPRWVRAAALALSLIGLGLSIYLTIAHLAGANILICSSKGLVNCEAVTTSPESELFGILPVAELGLAFYVFMTVVNLPWLWRPEWRWLPTAGARLHRVLPLAAWRVRLAAVIVGVLFILYLVYTELITLRTICLWCTYVHITTFVLFVVLVTQATFWGSPAKAAADSTAGRRTR